MLDDDPIQEEPVAEVAPAEGGTSWLGWLGLLPALTGLAAAAAIVLNQPPPPEPEEDPVPDPAESQRGIPFPDARFFRLGQDILSAESPAQRIQAGLAMYDFLMAAGGWRTERERFLMAREYLLALADMNPIGRQRPLVAQALFELSIPLRDQELLAAGDRLVRGEPPMEERPFELLCAEADAWLAIGDPATAFARIDELGAREESAASPWPYLVRMARALRRALDFPEAMAALAAHRGLPPEAPGLRAQVLAELATRSADLSSSSSTEMEAEGLWNQAYAASGRGDPDGAIGFLQQAIGKGLTRFRPLAFVRLNEILRDEGRDREQAQVLSRMVVRPELRAHALAELRARLGRPADEEIAQSLLVVVKHYVDVLGASDPPDPRLLLAAGQAAAWQGWAHVAHRYLDMAEAATIDRQVLADVMMARADMAEADGNRLEMIRNMVEVVSLNPRHPREGDIRYRLLREMADQPYSEADLVGGIIGAVTRLPRDSRGIEGMLMVARRLEAIGLNGLAETYYRHAILLTSLQQVRKAETITAEALLGQVRTMLAQEKTAEADALLRVLNTNVRWSEYWNQSGPLWAAIAFRQGQFREGVRRWRHTCGPPGGELLPRLFELLVPDVGDRSLRIDVAVPRRPARVPLDMVAVAACAAVDRLLEQEDYETLDRLLATMERDPEWKGRLPVAEYRTRYLKQVAARQSPAEAFEWLRRHPVAAAEPDAPDVGAWMERVEEMARQARLLGP